MCQNICRFLFKCNHIFEESSLSEAENISNRISSQMYKVIMQRKKLCFITCQLFFYKSFALIIFLQNMYIMLTTTNWQISWQYQGYCRVHVGMGEMQWQLHYVEKVCLEWHEGSWAVSSCCPTLYPLLVYDSVVVRRAGLMRSHGDPEMWWSVPFTCAWLYSSFILFCLLLVYSSQYSFFNYVLIVAFWKFTYHKIWILLNIYCFIWNYWIIYFVACLEVFGVLWVNWCHLAVDKEGLG